MTRSNDALPIETLKARVSEHVTAVNASAPGEGINYTQQSVLFPTFRDDVPAVVFLVMFPGFPWKIASGSRATPTAAWYYDARTAEFLGKTSLGASELLGVEPNVGAAAPESNRRALDAIVGELMPRFYARSSCPAARADEYRKALVAVEGRLVLAPFQACVGDWFDWVGGNAR